MLNIRYVSVRLSSWLPVLIARMMYLNSVELHKQNNAHTLFGDRFHENAFRKTYVRYTYVRRWVVAVFTAKRHLCLTYVYLVFRVHG